MDANTITRMIRDAMPEADVQVKGDDGRHFEAVVISTAFEGLPTLQRHRRVYAALGDYLGGEIHALALRTLTPAEIHGNG